MPKKKTNKFFFTPKGRTLPYPCKYKADGTTVIDLTGENEDPGTKSNSDAIETLTREVAQLKRYVCLFRFKTPEFIFKFIIQGDEVDKTQERRTVIDFEHKRQGSDRQVR
jgi:hypothetical protein